MAKTLHGEISLHIYGQRHTLRPSLGALYEIEQRLDMTIPMLIKLVSKNNASADTIRLILQEGFYAHHGSATKFPALSRSQLKKLWPVALTFLIQGMGYLFIESKEPPSHSTGLETEVGALICENQEASAAPNNATIAPAAIPDFHFEPLPWGSIYESATMLLGVSQSEYWHMTIPELSRLAEMLARMHGADTGYGGMPAIRSDLDWLREQFPDPPTTRSTMR